MYNLTAYSYSEVVLPWHVPKPGAAEAVMDKSDMQRDLWALAKMAGEVKSWLHTHRTKCSYADVVAKAKRVETEL
eukprot:3962263-Prymnesium_polylepis.1